MKKILYVISIIILISFVSASSIIYPENNQYISEGLINMSSNLTNSNINFYVSNSTIFNQRPVCSYEYSSENNYSCYFEYILNDIPEDELNAYFKLDSDNPYKNEIGTGDIYSNTGATQIYQGGAIQDAFSFGGTYGNLQANYIKDFDLSNYTFSAWVKKEVSGGDSNGRVLDFQSFCIILSSPTQLRISNYASYDSFTIQLLDSWYNIVVIRQPYGYYEAYINGEFVGNGTKSKDNVWQNLEIGGRSFNDRTFLGEIDEIMIWNKSLTDNEINNLYITGDGKYYAKINDTNGTTYEDNKTFLLDLNNPIINLYSPKYETINAIINFSTEDINQFSNISVNVSIDDTEVDYFENNLSINYLECPFLTKGKHNLKITAIDYSGRETTKTKSFLLGKNIIETIYTEEQNFIEKIYSNVENLYVKYFVN